MPYTMRSLRESRGCTKEDALKCLGVSLSVYETYEKDPGLIPKHIACKMRKACGVSLDSLDIKVEDICMVN